MKTKFLSLCLASTLLSACVSKPDINLASDPIAIEASELSKYWVNQNPDFTFGIQPKFMPQKDTDGYVEIKYLIDSNGNLFNPEITESHPEGMWDYGGIKALTKFRYTQAEQNPSAQPVYVTTRIDFKF